jgi:hypothetical protein
MNIVLTGLTIIKRAGQPEKPDTLCKKYYPMQRKVYNKSPLKPTWQKCETIHMKLSGRKVQFTYTVRNYTLSNF